MCLGEKVGMRRERRGDWGGEKEGGRGGGDYAD